MLFGFVSTFWVKKFETFDRPLSVMLEIRDDNGAEAEVDLVLLNRWQLHKIENFASGLDVERNTST